MEDMENFLKNLGVGLRTINDPFFEDSYNYCKVFKRTGVTVEDEEELCHEIMQEFRCNACDATFQNLLDYELHYNNAHRFVCGQCKKWRPTSRLLEIHVQETHDNFFKVLAEKQPMYQCFVSGCNLKFNDPIERRYHCREIHEFPKNYRFDDSTNQKANKVSEVTLMETDENRSSSSQRNSKIYFGKNIKQKTFTKKMNNLKNGTNLNTKILAESKFLPATMFVPRQVQQNSYAKRLTNNRRVKNTNVLESGSMMELGETLPNS